MARSKRRTRARGGVHHPGPPGPPVDQHVEVDVPPIETPDAEALARLDGAALRVSIDFEGRSEVDYAVPPSVAVEWLEYILLIVRKDADGAAR